MRQQLHKGDQVPFTQVANSILADKKISWKAKGIWAYLYSKPNDWDFHGDRIVDDGLDGRHLVYSALRELESKGYLTRKKQSDGRIDYIIRYEPIDGFQQLGKKPVAENRKVQKPQSAEISNISNIDISLDTVLNNIEKKETLPFDDFWKIYPRKVEKKKSQQKWSKLSETDRKSAMLDIPARAQSDQWKREGGRFIPYPTTYLNGERWNDEIVAPAVYSTIRQTTKI
jgi:hypothetical protein